MTLLTSIICVQVAIFAGPYPRFQDDTYNDGAEQFSRTCGRLPTCSGTPDNAQGVCIGTCAEGACSDSSGRPIYLCVSGDCSAQNGIISSCTLAFSQTAECPLGCSFTPPEGVAAVQEDCAINSAIEACRPLNNPWGTFLAVSDDRCNSLLTSGDPAACTERPPGAVDSINITVAANVIILAAVDVTIVPDMKLQIQDAVGQTCLVTPKNTELRVASVADAAIEFTSDFLTDDPAAATSCVVTGLTGCSYTPPPSSLKVDPADTDSADCFAIGGAGTNLGDDCNSDARCRYNDQGTTTPSCGVSYASICESYGIKTAEGAMPTRATDFAAGGACIADADRDLNTHPDPRCEYIDGGTVQTCVPIDVDASQTVIDACEEKAANGEDACIATGECTYTTNDVSDDYCQVFDNTGMMTRTAAFICGPLDVPVDLLLTQSLLASVHSCIRLCFSHSNMHSQSSGG